MTAGKALVTAEELLCMGSDGERFELIDGELVEMSPTGELHARVTAMISYLLLAYVRPRRLGRVLVADPGVVLRRNPDHVRAPDVAFIARERLPAGPPSKGFLTVAPDLAVEVVSPSDRPGAVRAKSLEWLRAGVRLVWEVYPEEMRVIALQALDNINVLGIDDVLTAEPVLPGFACPVAELFDE
jgi:Uma2 family endonuclease